MKKFTKFMLSVAAITAVSSVMAVSAMAAVEGAYDAESGKVTLTGVESSGDQQTLLVLTEDANTVTEGIIAQIDQDTAISEFILPAGIESGTYYVRIGGTDGTIQTATLTIGGSGGGGGEPTTHEVRIGDVDQNGRVTAGDASLVLTLVAEKNTGSLTGDALVAAQKCNGLSDTRVTSADASAILTYNANKKHDYVNTMFEVAD